MTLSTDKQYLRDCFKLAEKALGETSPNPLVGCVIVKDSKVISTGYHKKSGSPHAELDAIQNSQVSLKGSTLYCNLEPCCHTNKKTPPCAQRIIKEQIKRVVISNLDPNPEVAGKGVELLKSAGIEVSVGIEREAGERLNEVFFTHITNKRPFIHLKWAQTLDGKISTKSGDSKWITNELSRQNVHRERLQYDAIMVGSNTIKIDNPSLTVRDNDKVIKCPKRIILSNSNQIDKNSNVFTDDYKHKTEVINSEDGLKKTLEKLYKDGITSIYVEGGTKVITSFLKEELYDRISIYIAPKILGGDARPSVNEMSISSMKDALILGEVEISSFGTDVLIVGKKSCLQA